MDLKKLCVISERVMMIKHLA